MTSPRRSPAAALLALAILASMLSLPAHAALRAPQVPVSGSALATFFASQGQSIDVNTQQLDLQRTNVPSNTSFRARMFLPTSSPLGIYNAASASPALYQVLPGTLPAGWFAEAAFRAAPTRVVVNLFDAFVTIQGTTTYLGADYTDFAFYTLGVPGTVWMQDARNAGGSPRFLAFSGTGAFIGSTWLCAETGAGPGGDFADVIALIELTLAPVAGQSTTWHRVKQLYR